MEKVKYLEPFISNFFTPLVSWSVKKYNIQLSQIEGDQSFDDYSIIDTSRECTSYSEKRRASLNRNNENRVKVLFKPTKHP